MEEQSQTMERQGRLQDTQRRREAAAVPRMLARRVRHGLQLQLRRKEQINRMLRKGLISTRKQLNLKKLRLRKYKLLSEKMKKEMEEQLENKNETIVDLHIQVQWLKKDVEQFSVKERTLQCEKEELANEIMTMNTSLQNQLLENTVLANQATELQQQLELKDQTISYLLIYRQNLEDDFVTIHEKLDLLDQEMDQMVHERNLILHYVVTMQACLYDDVEQWLHQLLEDGRITETSVLKFKSMQEQINLMKPILARDRAVLEEEEQEGEEEDEEEEEEEEDEEDEEDEEEEADGEQEGGEVQGGGEDWETTESEEAEEERAEGGGEVEEEESKETTEGKAVGEGEKQREVEEDKKLEEKKERATDDEDFFKFRHQTDQSTSTDRRRKNVFEDMSESESRRADSSSSGLSSRSTSSTARNSSNLDSNGSTSTGSVEKSKIRKKSKLKSWFKKRFTLKATRKPTARASDHRDSKKASESSVDTVVKKCTW